MFSLKFQFNCFVIFYLYIFVLVQSVTDSRSIAALVEICERFPTLASCQPASSKTDVPLTVPFLQSTAIPVLFTVSPYPSIVVTTDAPVPALPAAASVGPDMPLTVDEYCNKYEKHYSYFCINKNEDSAEIRHFCNSYFLACVQQGTVRPTTPVVPTLPPVVTDGPVVSGSYCANNLKDYNNLCLREFVPGFAVNFCAGYHAQCPVSSEPGVRVLGSSRFFRRLRRAVLQTSAQSSNASVSTSNIKPLGDDTGVTPHKCELVPVVPPGEPSQASTPFPVIFDLANLANGNQISSNGISGSQNSANGNQIGPNGVPGYVNPNPNYAFGSQYANSQYAPFAFGEEKIAQPYVGALDASKQALSALNTNGGNWNAFTGRRR